MIGSVWVSLPPGTDVLVDIAEYLPVVAIFVGIVAGWIVGKVLWLWVRFLSERKA
jgi:hypothetical protein